MKLHYVYTKYPYSKEATDLDHLASLFLFLAVLITLGSIVELVFEGPGKNIFFILGGLLYIILFHFKIVPSIKKIAEEDYKRHVRKMGLAEKEFPKKRNENESSTEHFIDANLENKMADKEKNVPETTSKIMFCNKCGFKLLDNSEFCSGCGTKVSKE